MIFTDGFSNKLESGFTLCDKDGKLLARKLYHRITCNHAELLGIYYAAVAARFNEQIITDSKVCTFWLRKQDAAARPDLNNLLRDTNRLIQEKRLRLQWLPREENLAGRFNESQSKPQSQRRTATKR